MVKQCVERNVEKVDTVLLDWKGIRGADKKRLIVILNDVGVSIEKV